MMSNRELLILSLLVALLLMREAMRVWRRAHKQKDRDRKRGN
jgi:hypothetical protein